MRCRGWLTHPFARTSRRAPARLISAASSAGSWQGAGSVTVIRPAVIVSRPAAASRTSSEPIKPKPSCCAVVTRPSAGDTDSRTRSSPSESSASMASRYADTAEVPGEQTLPRHPSVIPLAQELGRPYPAQPAGQRLRRRYHAAMGGWNAVIDVSNVCWDAQLPPEGHRRPIWSRLQLVMQAWRRQHGRDARFHLVADDSLVHSLDDLREHGRLQTSGRLTVVPVADVEILSLARDHDVHIITRDHFVDHRCEHPWIR